MRKPRNRRAFGIGESTPRLEDARFLTGHGRYVDDLAVPNSAFAVFVRSPHAHARVEAIHCAAAKAMPGVLAILTGANWTADDGGRLACMYAVTSDDGSPMKEATRPVMVTDIARHVGEPLAMVVADTLAHALDAAEAVEPEMTVLEAMTDLALASSQHATLVHASFATNVAFDWSVGDSSTTHRTIQDADHVASIDVLNNRVYGFTLEPRAATGRYDPMDDSYTLWSTTQMPHVMRECLAEQSLRVPAHRIRVIAPDIGGGFGLKGCHYAEEAAVLWAAKRVGRPVRWTATRGESFVADVHARDHRTNAKIAFNDSGRILGVWVDVLANLGAYVSLFGPGCPGIFGMGSICGIYDIPSAYFRVRGLYTHTVPTEAYRGAGMPEATYVIERLMDKVAEVLSMDPLALRAHNVLPTHETPITNVLGVTLDSGDYGRASELIAARCALWRKRQSKQTDRIIGIGIAGYVLVASGASSHDNLRGGSRLSNWEHVRLSVHRGGQITLSCGTHSHGQGHETTFRQVISTKLGCDPDDIDIVYGDTGRVHAGLGTYASRAMVLAGSAMSKASDRIIAKAKQLAAHTFECTPDDIEFDEGQFRVAGTDRVLAFNDIAAVAWQGDAWPEGFEPGLDESCYLDPQGATTPSGFHLCVIELDAETGGLKLLDYMAADDFGRVINPMIVDGQVHGAVTQGLGQALGEWCVYDDTGQLLAGSAMDYQLLRAADLPAFELTRIQTPAPGNPLGIKGMGEAGALPAPPAIANALRDALTCFHCPMPDMPFTPYRVWKAITGAKVGSG